MTRRSLPEWIGKTPDTAAPPRVKLRVFDKYEGKCHVSGRKIRVGDKWQLDHIIALANGGENRETNLAPILDKPHKAKTANDVAQKAKTERIRKKHLGIASDKPKPGPTFKGRPIMKKLNGGIVYRDTGLPI